MSQFETSWELSRKRFVDEISSLSSEQLNWRLHPNSLTIGEMALHVAGVEISFASQLSGTELSDEQARLKSAATDGVVNRNPFPFGEAEIHPPLVKAALENSLQMVKPLMENPEPIWSKELVSALGPVITGEGALARLAFHSAYHQGQAYLIRTSPGFPNV